MIEKNRLTGLHFFLFFLIYKTTPVSFGIQCGVVMQNQKGTLGGASKFSISKLLDQTVWLKLPISCFFSTAASSLSFLETNRHKPKSTQGTKEVEICQCWV